MNLIIYKREHMLTKLELYNHISASNIIVGLHVTEGLKIEKKCDEMYGNINKSNNNMNNINNSITKTIT